jgi:hypothetical protein
MKAIINNGQKFGTLNGVFTLNSEIKKVVFSKLKENKATKLIDTDETLMYEIIE